MTPDAGQRLIVSELLAMHKLMEYADAWRTTPGCSCGQCQLCEARGLSADDADAIAAILHESIKTIERLRGAIDRNGRDVDVRRYRWLRDHARDANFRCPTVWDTFRDGEPNNIMSGRDLDCAVDAAIAASRSTGAADVGEARG